MAKLNAKITLLKGVYILPSLVTTAGLSMGFISILCSINSNLSLAAWCIIASIGFDILDGRVARWTKSSSHFGVELDSLADLIAFGVAPAIMMYQMVLHTMGRPGIAISLLFVIAGALRLAKFNVKAHEGEFSGDFTGLPIPAAAGILASFVLSYELFEMGQEITVKTIPLLMKRMPFFFKAIPTIMVLTSLLMLSSIPYIGFKKLRFDRPKSIQLLIMVVVSIILILTYPQNTIFILFLLYLLSGMLSYLVRYWRLKRQ